jgi:hypothetical protein
MLSSLRPALKTSDSPLARKRPHTSIGVPEERKIVVSSLYIGAPTNEINTSDDVKSPHQTKYLRAKTPTRQPREKVYYHTTYSQAETHVAFLTVNGKSNSNPNVFKALEIAVPKSPSNSATTSPSGYLRKVKLSPKSPIEIVAGTIRNESMYKCAPQPRTPPKPSTPKKREIPKSNMFCVGIPLKE